MSGGHDHKVVVSYWITDGRLSAIASDYMRQPTNTVHLCFAHATQAVVKGADVGQDVQTDPYIEAHCDICFNRYTDMTLESLLECLELT